MEADFLRYYHLDLWADLGTPRLTWRRFGALTSSLPWDSAYVRSLSGGTNGVSFSDQLLGMVVDTLRVQLWANADPKTRGEQPEPILGELLGIESPRSRTRRTPAEMRKRLYEIALENRDRHQEVQ